MAEHRVSMSPYDGFGPTPSNNGGFTIHTTHWQWFPFPGYYEDGYVSSVCSTYQEAVDWGDAQVAAGAGGYHVYWLDPPPAPKDTPKDGDQE